jgi:hypothetical protein
MAGMTISVSRVDETMPPIIGTAIRCMISEPVPLDHRIGSSPAMVDGLLCAGRAYRAGAAVRRAKAEEAGSAGPGGAVPDPAAARNPSLLQAT